jgi:hypothetical protein
VDLVAGKAGVIYSSPFFLYYFQINREFRAKSILEIIYYSFFIKVVWIQLIKAGHFDPVFF